MSSKSLTILFTPLDGHGHINACHGIAEGLRDRGHKVVFAIDIAFKDKLKPYGFEEEIHSLPKKPDVNPDISIWADFVSKHGDIFKLSPIEIVEKFCTLGFTQMFDELKARDMQYKQIISRVKPDIIITDSYIASPTQTNSGIPWVWLYSAAPLTCFNDKRLPPGWSGIL
jgi:spore coat polysaccharide biosynthesis predicted glycosyltransferase SpsG